MSAGLSKCSQRTDEAVSGSRTQMSPPAAFLLTPAVAPATTSVAIPATTAMTRTVDLRKTFLTWFLLTGGTACHAPVEPLHERLTFRRETLGNVAARQVA